MKQNRRFFITCVGGTVVLIAILGGIKAWQIMAAISAHSGKGPPPEGVATTVVKEEIWQPTFSVVGTVDSERGALLRAEVAGTLQKIYFTPGQTVAEGEILFSLDNSVERAELSRAEAELELANQNLSRITSLYKAKASSKETYDNATAMQLSRSADVARMRSLIDKKNVKAPFTGVVGIRRANVGEYIEPGTPIVELRDPKEMNVDFEVSQERFDAIKPGEVVAVSAGENQTTATVTSVDPAFDARSRTIRIRARLASSEDNKLRAGMFVSILVNNGDTLSVIFVPSSSIMYAPFGDSVFAVEDGEPMPTVKKIIVRLGPAQGKRVPVLSGLDAGTRIVSSGAFKLQPGAPIILSDKSLPSNIPLSEEAS